MVANLNGVIFSQVYGDNSGGAEFDTDGDGTATQEDEFVAVQNTTGAAIDISGWQIWSDMSGAGAPDGPQDGLYHTFPPGTVIAPGKKLFVVNEITGVPAPYMQEASEGGVESGAGGVNTNFLSEGELTLSESLALVDPVSGDYIIFNMSGANPSSIPGLPGFPGTTSVGEDNAATDSGEEDQDAGSAYAYNAVTDSYDYQAVAVTCFTVGTRVEVPGGCKPVEDLKPGDLVETRDNGPQELRLILHRKMSFRNGCHSQHKPIEFKAGALGPGQPARRLVVSPQHRLLMHDVDNTEVLAPAKGLLPRKGVRVMSGCRDITYIHLVFTRHEIVKSENIWSESFYPGKWSFNRSSQRIRTELRQIFPDLRHGFWPKPCRTLMRVGEVNNLDHKICAAAR